MEDEKNSIKYYLDCKFEFNDLFLMKKLEYFLNNYF